MILVLVVGGLALCGMLGLFLLGLVGSGASGEAMIEGGALQEVVVRDQDTADKIAMISVEGVISGTSFDGSGSSLVDYLKQQLKQAGKDDRVKAVVLKVDSPGGEVLASDEIYYAIQKFQTEQGKPVVAVMKSMAASGGYYVSAPCRWIVAHELTLTGSIGVIMQGYNFRGLMDKVGVSAQVFKSGQYKDMLGSTRRPEDITDEEKAMVQNLVGEAFERFKAVIADGRAYAAKQNAEDGRKLVTNWTDYADGRVLTGKQAYEHGFVDELGDLDAGVDRAMKIAGIRDAKLVRYQRLFSFGSIFRLLGEQEKATIKVDLGLDTLKLQTGQLYFLPSFLAH